MLVLGRLKNEVIVINGNIRIKVVGITAKQVKLGFEAPDDVVIDREEIYIKKLNDANLG